jgi:hypothetical protein
VTVPERRARELTHICHTRITSIIEEYHARSITTDATRIASVLTPDFHQHIYNSTCSEESLARMGLREDETEKEIMKQNGKRFMDDYRQQQVNLFTTLYNNVKGGVWTS